jgi:hypothetical protein
VREWLTQHPRWTPASASWLNAVEGFFAKLTSRRLKRAKRRQPDDRPIIAPMGTDILVDLKNWLKQLTRDPWHQERMDEQIDLVNRAIAVSIRRPRHRGSRYGRAYATSMIPRRKVPGASKKFFRQIWVAECRRSRIFIVSSHSRRTAVQNKRELDDASTERR